MSYVYRELRRGAVEWDVVRTAERVLEAARETLDLPPTYIRWYARAGNEQPHQLTRHGRLLDVEDSRHLAGWHVEPPCIAIRADRPLREIGLTVGHEVYHVWQKTHDKPMDEAPAEAFARRLVAQLAGETE